MIMRLCGQQLAVSQRVRVEFCASNPCAPARAFAR